MFKFRSTTLQLSAVLMIASCSGAKDAQTVSVAGKSGATANNNGGSSLALQSVDSSAEAPKSLLQSADFKWAITDNDLYLSRADGKSLRYDRGSSEWGAIESFTDAESYAALFAFHDGSYTGIKPGILSFRTGTHKLLSYDISTVLPEGSPVLGVSPGFFAAKISDGIMVLRGENATAKSVKLKDPPVSLTEAGSCISGCVLWGSDGQALYSFGEDSTWAKHPIPFEAPLGKKIARYTMSVTMDATTRKLTASNVAVLTDDGLLFVSTKGAAAGTVTFEEVKKLSLAYCVSCHSGEAFEQEAGLKAKKTEIIKRLGLGQDDGLVMPPKAAPKAMTSGDKKIMVAWLTLQTEGVDTGPIVTNPNPTVDNATVPITGVLLTQSNKYCVSCHPVAKFKAFWIDEKSDILNRVNSGNMPAGQTMTPADKAALIQAINDLM